MQDALSSEVFAAAAPVLNSLYLSSVSTVLHIKNILQLKHGRYSWNADSQCQYFNFLLMKCKQADNGRKYNPKDFFFE